MTGTDNVRRVRCRIAEVTCVAISVRIHQTEEVKGSRREYSIADRGIEGQRDTYRKINQAT